MTIQETGPLTTESGALVADNRNGEQGGVSGPGLFQSHRLTAKYSLLLRERAVRMCDAGAGIGRSARRRAHGLDRPCSSRVLAFSTGHIS